MLSRSVVSDSVIPWTVAHQAPLSLGFPRQEYWSGLPCPPPGDLPDPGMEPSSHTSPALAGGFFTASTTWMPPDILLAFIQVTVNISRIGVITVIKVNILLCLMFVAEWKGQGKHHQRFQRQESGEDCTLFTAIFTVCGRKTRRLWLRVLGLEMPFAKYDFTPWRGQMPIWEV